MKNKKGLGGVLFSKHDFGVTIVMGAIVCAMKCQYVPYVDDCRYAFNAFSGSLLCLSMM